MSWKSKSISWDSLRNIGCKCKAYFLMYFPSAVLERALIHKCTLNALFSISVSLNSFQVGVSLRVLNSFFLDRCIYLVCVGTSNWTVRRDNKCSSNEMMKVQASLNSCMENFNCASGDCIPMVQRCNGINDCSDSSDEVNCKVGNLAVKYLPSFYS